MRTIARDAADIWMDERGHGELVLLVHGGLFDPMDGERFWNVPGVVDDLVAAGYRTRVPDRRYSIGRTRCDYRAHSWDIEADDLAAVLGREPAHVVAGSNGCSAAIRLALTRPELVRALVLCWPATPDNADLERHCARSAAWLEEVGPATYLAELRANGLPRPEQARPGFPYGAALLCDERLAASFLSVSGPKAADIMRATAVALLPGEMLRGVSGTAALRLREHGRRVTIIPAEPEDPFHRRTTAERLAAALPDARLTAGTPLTPAPGFAAARGAFAALLGAALCGASGGE